MVAPKIFYLNQSMYEAMLENVYILKGKQVLSSENISDDNIIMHCLANIRYSLNYSPNKCKQITTLSYTDTVIALLIHIHLTFVAN